MTGKRTNRSPIGIIQGFCFSTEGFKTYIEEYLKIHQSWMNSVDCITLLGDEGRGSFKCVLGFNSKDMVNPQSTCILLYYGIFKESSDVIQSILPDLHIQYIEKIARKMNVPFVLSGDTKYLRAMLRLGDGGHPKRKLLSNLIFTYLVSKIWQ